MISCRNSVLSVEGSLLIVALNLDLRHVSHSLELIDIIIASSFGNSFTALGRCLRVVSPKCPNRWCHMDSLVIEFRTVVVLGVKGSRNSPWFNIALILLFLMLREHKSSLKITLTPFLVMVLSEIILTLKSGTR